MNSGARLAARTWARPDLRQRWIALIALGLLAGVTAGVAIASLAGARRTNSALGRLERTTDAWVPLVLLIPLTVVVVNLLAVLPGRTVARQAFPVKALRAE